MTATEWAHLPNAALIDRVVADVAQRPEVWAAAWDATWDAARSAAWTAAHDAAMDAARSAARGAARDAAWDAGARVHDEAHDAAWDALLALIAWDDAGPLLDTPVPALRLYAANGSHAAVLMLPAAIALGETA